MNKIIIKNIFGGEIMTIETDGHSLDLSNVDMRLSVLCISD